MALVFAAELSDLRRWCLAEPQTAAARTKIKGAAHSSRDRMASFTSKSLLPAISQGRIFMRDERLATNQTFAARLRHLRRDIGARTLHGARPPAQLPTPLHHRALRRLRRFAHAAGDERRRAHLLLPRGLLGRRAGARLDTQVASSEAALHGSVRVGRQTVS